MVCSATVSHGHNVDKHIQVQLLEQTPGSLSFLIALLRIPQVIVQFVAGPEVA